MKYAAADIAWEGGGHASYGDEVDETVVPEATRTRWIEAGILVDDAPGPRLDDESSSGVVLGDKMKEG